MGEMKNTLQHLSNIFIILQYILEYVFGVFLGHFMYPDISVNLIRLCVHMWYGSVCTHTPLPQHIDPTRTNFTRKCDSIHATWILGGALCRAKKTFSCDRKVTNLAQ